MRNSFAEKLYAKCGEKTLLGTFSKNQIWGYLWINSLKFPCSLFFIYAKLRDIEIYWNSASDHLLFHHIEIFKKKKKRSGTNLPASFSAWFLKKNISIVIFYSLTKFHCLVVFISWDIGQCVLALQQTIIILFVDVILTKTFFYMVKNSRQKFEYLENEKSF